MKCDGGIVHAIIQTAFRNKAVVVMLVALATFFGAYAFWEMPRNVYPDITIPVFTIVAENEAMAPEEIEMMITRPMEAAMNGLPGVRRIRSQTTQGLSTVVVEFGIETEFWQARQFVTERMAQIAAQLPPGSEPPTLSSATTRLAEVYELAIEGDLPLKQLREIAEWQVRYNLLTVPGVAEVLNMGGYFLQYRVTLDPTRIAGQGVTLSRIESAIKGANENAAGGFISTGPTEYTVRGIGRYETLDDIRETVIAEHNGIPVYLKDIADIEESTAIRRGIASKNGKETVVALVIKQPTADTVQVVEGIRKAIADLQVNLPQGVHLTPYYDQTFLINHSLSSVIRAILIGSVLVVIVLLLFLGHFKSTLVVAISLPLSVAMAGLLMRHFEVGLNTMSLGGLAIAVGIMVDASIIMVENIYHRFHQTHDQLADPTTRDAIAHKAANEVGRPITYATFIIVAVFLPLYLLGGMEGLLFRPLAITVSAAMLVALLLSLTLTPVLGTRLLNISSPTSRAEGEVLVVRGIKKLYVPMLNWAFRHAWLTVILALLVTIPILSAFSFVGRDFMPRLDEGAWIISTITPPETSLEENNKITARIEQTLLKNPDIESVIRRNGRSERAIGCVLPVNSGEITVNLKPKAQRKKPADQILAETRKEVEEIAGVAAVFTQPLQLKIDESLEGTPSPLQVKIFGSDLNQLAKLAKQFEKIMQQTKGVADIKASQATGIPQLQVKIDRKAAARYGVSVETLSEVIRLAIGGEELTQLWDKQRSYGVFVRYPETARNSPEAIANILLTTPTGASIPLSQLAEIILTEGPNTIWREAMNRCVTVDASIQDRDLTSIVRDLQQAAKELKLPEGYFVIYGGQYQNQQRAMRSLAAATAVALLVVFMLLYLALKSMRDATLILATLPAALVGGVVALLFTGETLNVSSGVGFIALFGIAVQNGLVLLTQSREFEVKGNTKEESIRLASIGRLRPKLMTASCAALGVVPILISSGVGAEIEKPLAIVLVGGLLSSTIFTLLVLPSVFVLAERIIPVKSFRH